MIKLNKTRAFLTEFIIVILFFSIAAVITMELYVEAHNMSKSGISLSDATVYAGNVAEHIRAGEQRYNDDGIFTDYLDEDINSTGKTEAVYIKKVVVSTDKSLRRYSIIMAEAKNEEEIYSLEFMQFESKEAQ